MTLQRCEMRIIVWSMITDMHSAWHSTFMHEKRAKCKELCEKTFPDKEVNPSDINVIVQLADSSIDAAEREINRVLRYV